MMSMLKFYVSSVSKSKLHKKNKILLEKIKANIEDQSNNGKDIFNLILFTETCLSGSFYPNPHRFCFHNFTRLQMGFFDNNFIVESENSTLSRDEKVPKSNHRFHISCGAMLGHTKKSHDLRM